MPHIGLKVTAAVAILAGSAGIGEPSSKKSFTMHCGELHGMRASMGDLGKQSRGQGVIWKRDGYDGQTTTVSWTPNDPDTLLFVLGGDRPTKTTIEAHVLYNDGHAIFAINKCRRAGRGILRQNNQRVGLWSLSVPVPVMGI